MRSDHTIATIIAEITHRLVTAYAPRKIVLFGSYAYGQPGADSDIDLLIIKDTPAPFPERLDTVRRLLTGSHPHIPLEPLVLTPDELEQRMRAGDQFIAEIVRQGKVLHAA